MSENFKILRDFMEQEEATTRRPWVEMWIQAILRSAGGGFQGLPELDEFLERRGKKMVCILDGLEDLCMDAQLARTDTWKYAVRAICQDVINELDNLDYAGMNMVYPDRLIMPLEIRNAILPCSEDKLEEIKSEMKNIYEILQKFMDMDSEKKTLPMTLDKIELTGEQISRLEGQGFLKISDKKYYLPEIIRLALGFRYEKGARPKVLSLLVK